MVGEEVEVTQAADGPSLAQVFKTRIDPFARHLRKDLRRKWGIDCSRPIGVLAVYSEETPSPPRALAYDAAMIIGRAAIEKVRAAVTDGTGQYRIIDLRPGTYTVTAELSGFKTVSRPGRESS